MFKARGRVSLIIPILAITIGAPAQTRIAQISDIHLGNPAAPNARPRLLAIVESINELQPDAVIVSGDIAEVPAGWFEVRQILSAISRPVFYVPGNHDTDGTDTAIYRSTFGPDYYRLELETVTVFVLNSQLLGNFTDINAQTPLPMNPIAQAEGEQMLLWLAQQMPIPGKVAIAIQHVPLFFSERLPSVRPYWVINEPFRSREVAELQRLGVRHLLAGHWHMPDVEDELLVQHVVPSVAWPLFKGQLGYSLHSISANGAVRTERIAPTADLSVKITSPDVVGAGDVVNYSISVENQGPLAASGVVVTDTFPGAQTFVSSTTSQGSCAGSNQLICDIGAIPSQGEARLTVAIETQDVGTITNMATVAANQYDFKQAENQARKDTSVQNRDFLLRISPASATVKAGNSATYTVTVVPASAGFRNEVSFSCPGLAAAATCRFAPAQLVPGNEQRSSTLTVSVAPSVGVTERSHSYIQWVIAVLALAGAGVGLPRRTRSVKKSVSALLFLLVLGCGGGAQDSKQSAQKPATTMTIIVSGASGSIQRKATATLIVQ